MKITAIILLTFILVFGQNVQTGVNINGAPGVYNINTADNYSWQTRTSVYNFTHTKVAEISHILKECLSDYGKIQINDHMNMVVITEEANKLQNILDLCIQLDVEDMKEFVKLETETIQLNYTVPSTIQDYLKSYLSIDGSLQAYDDLNVLIVHDHQDVVDRIKGELTQFDISPKEIRIDFDIVEVINSDFADNGINWDELFTVVNANAGWNFSRDGDHTESQTTTNDVTSKTTTEKSGGDWRFNGGVSVSTRNFKNFLRFMVEDGAANYVSNNSLSVLNNHKSVFYYTYKESMVQVELLPNLINNETVKLDVEISVDGQVIFETVVHGKIGEVKKLVSFQNTEDMMSTKKVPGLGTVLPFLFSRKEKTKGDIKLDIVFTASM